MALTDNLVVYQKLNGNSTASVGPNGTDTSMSWTTGKIGQAGDFDYVATGSMISLGASSGIVSGGTARTISFRTYIDVATDDRYFCSLGSVANGQLFAPRMYSGGGQRLGIMITNGGGWTDVTSNINAATLVGGWHYLTFTYDGATTCKIYIDAGTPYSGSTGATLATAGAGTCYIGARDYTSARNGVNAKIDEFGIRSRELTATEVTGLYNSGAGLTYPFAATDTAKFLQLF